MGRRTNYGFEKRQKELKRQKKKEKKMEERRARKQPPAEAGESDTATEPTDAANDGEEQGQS